MALVLQWLTQYDFRLLPLKPDVVVRFKKLPLYAWRGDLQRVVTRHDIFHVQNRPHVVGNHFAIGVTDSLRLVNRDSQQLIPAAAFELDLDHFNSVRSGHPLDDFLDF